jgi:RHS repeat-associated protein
VTLQWEAVPDSGYWVCWDTTNNNSCDTLWWPNGGATTRQLENLAATTYYWQVKADTPFGQFPADSDTWWSFTVGGGGGPSKSAPAPDLSGLSSTVLLQWTPIPDDGYSVCVDTTNNNLCDTAWWPNGGATSRVVESLAAGTYYWQVKSATTGAEFNGGTWWAFTVGQPAVSFGKQTPGAGAQLLTNHTTLSWTTASGAAFYEFCIDTVNNGQCDAQWMPTELNQTRLVTGLTDGTYYWQVRATLSGGGQVFADNPTWWTLTIDAPDPIREYIYVGGDLLASLTLTTGTPVLTYYHTDVLGSVRAVTSATGAPLARHDYQAFGESASPLTGDPRRYLGQERDAETGFDLFGARYYRNVWGRFAAVDPIVSGAITNPQKWNRYAYALNNPLRYVDPSGLDPEEPDPVEADWSCSAICQEFNSWADQYVYENENIDGLLALQQRWRLEAAAKRAAKDGAERLIVDAAITSAALWDLFLTWTWQPANGTEPGTYVGQAPRGGIEKLLQANADFSSRAARGGHAQRLGAGSTEFQAASPYTQNRPGGLRSLHVTVNPEGRFEIHVDRFNPYEGLAPVLLHIFIEWLPPRLN